MKTKNLLYISSIIILIGSIFLVIEYQNSQRIQGIAELLTVIGFAMNIIGFAMKTR